MNWIYKISLLAQTNATRACNPSTPSDKLCNAIPGAHDLEGLLTKFMADIGGVIGLLAIAVIVYAGLRMAAANGDKSVIDNAKKALTFGIYGFVLSIFAYTIVIATENFIGAGNINSGSTQPQNFLGQYHNLREFVEAMVQNVMGVIASVSLIMIIINGFKYLTSRGDNHQVEAAKKGITWSLAGLGLAILAYTIVSAINNFINKA